MKKKKKTNKKCRLYLLVNSKIAISIPWVHLVFPWKFKMDRFIPEVCQSFQYTPYLFINYINIEKKE